jgi:hypothetical protein
MLTILINSRLYEYPLFADSLQQHHLPFYPFLVSILYVFVMLPMVIFPLNKEANFKKENPEINDTPALFRYDHRTVLTTKRIIDKDSEDIIFIVRQKISK